MKTEESSILEDESAHKTKSPKQPRIKTRIAKTVIEEYDPQKNFENEKKKAIKEHLMKRKKYGNDV